MSRFERELPDLTLRALQVRPMLAASDCGEAVTTATRKTTSDTQRPVIQGDEMAGNVIVLDDNNFKTEVLDSSVPVLVDFWATWCGPCRAVAPIVEQLATDFDGRAKVAKLDVDTARSVAQQYNITSIPTIIVFKGGQAVDQVMGARPKAQLAQLLDRNL